MLGGLLALAPQRAENGTTGRDVKHQGVQAEYEVEEFVFRRSSRKGIVRRDQRGFTLIELLVAMGLLSILLTLGAFALRNFWLLRSLEGGREEVVSQMRAIQQKVVAESHPLYYGVWLVPGSSDWGLVRYDGSGATPTCVSGGTNRFDAGVEVAAVDVPDDSVHTVSGVPMGGSGGPIQTCLAGPAPAGSKFFFFLARGTSTEGRITLRQDGISPSDRTIEVKGLNGRVVE